MLLLERRQRRPLLTSVDPARNVVWLKDPLATIGEPAVAVDELRLSQVWSGETMLIRASAALTDEDAPFNLGWLGRS